ncbi:MAG: transporter substrate-binding domain-containing protein [Desulfocapsaceae bacterium]|nr:transporter substrate-binding domain-containing protein [Desulfocapsaceae bacterium]
MSKQERLFLSTHPVIRVGNEDDWPPFDFSTHGIAKGYAIDHLELLGKKLGISFEYVNGHTWEELLDLFRKGEIDLLPSLWYSKSREEFMLFTEPYLTLPFVIVTSNKTNSIEVFEDLYGKTIAVASGYLQEEVLQNLYPQIKLHHVTNPLEGLKAITYGEADAYIGYRGVVDYLIATRFFADLQIIGETKSAGLGPQGLYIAVNKDMELLRDLLQKAMDSVSEKEKVALSQKWISPQQKPIPQLTEEEAAYLLQHPILRADNLENWPPFNFYSNGSPRGFCIDYLQLLGEKLGISIDFVSGPSWKEFMTMLDNGEIDLLIDVVETEDRRRKIAFTAPYLTIFSGIVYRQGAGEFNGLKDLKGKKVVVPRDFYYEEILKKHYPSISFTTENSTLDCLRAVSSGKADAALAEKPVFDHLITKHFLTDLRSTPIVDSIHFENTPLSIGVQKERLMLRDIMQKAMNAVTEQELSEIYERWFESTGEETQGMRIPLSPEEQNYLAEKQEIRMCANPSWLPFEGIDERGNHIGIVAEIMSALTQKIGVDFNFVQTATWKESLEGVKNGRCDIVSSINTTNGKLQELLFTKPYFESVNVVISRDEQPYIPKLSILAGKSVAVAEGNHIIDYLSNNFPEISLLVMPNLQQALAAVAENRADAAIDNLQMVTYHIRQKGLYNLKIAGQTPYQDFLYIGINREESQLQSILNRALTSLSPRDIDRISRNWLSIRFEHSFDSTLLWKILAGAAVVIAIIAYWNRKLTLLNRELAKTHEDLAQQSLTLKKLSVTDGLTGLYNRIKLEDVLEKECQRSARSGHALTIIMLDVDRFKEINDANGHHAGDQVLRELAEILRGNTRSIDIVGRWGGEEFLLICPETDLAGAQTLAEKLRRIIEAHSFSEVDHCTCSFGIASYLTDERAGNAVIRADQAMYQAKENGRNSVMVAPAI